MFKDRDPTLYRTYTSIIKEFCLTQMKAGNIDDNLAICYQDLLDSGRIDSKIADGIISIIHTKKVICMEPMARRVFVIEDELKERSYAPFYGNVAFIPIYSEDNRVFIEYADGTVTVDDKLFYVEDPLNTSGVYEELKAYASDKETFFLHDFALMESSGEIQDTYEEEAINYLFDDRIDPYYLRRYFHIFIGFFKEHLREDLIMSALLHNDRYRDYDKGILTYLANLLIIDGQYDKALELFKDYLLLETDNRQLLNCLKKIVGDGITSKGEFVLELCIHLLRDGYHSEETIDYLLNHFIGLTDDMRSIFKYADPANEMLSDFCERFIVQGLYTGTITDKDDPILIAYLDSNPNPMIVEAYISYFSHLYVTNDKMPPDSVFAILFAQIRHTDAINDVCRFAYTRYLCQKDNLSRQETDVLNILVSDLIMRNIYFPFFADMSNEQIMKFNLYDRMYVSFKGEPGQDIIIAIKSKNEITEYDMNECYDGLYVKDIVVFFGETISYSVYNKTNPDEILKMGEYSYQDVGFMSESRFNNINKLEEKLFFKDTGNLAKEISNYQSRLNASYDLFQIL